MKRLALMLGAGHKEPKRLIMLPEWEGVEVEWKTLDLYVPADFDYDLERLEDGDDLPGGPYDEIHAYEVLEHFGRQGDERGFFNTFNALHRALKPGGYLIGSSPAWNSPWTWGDPGHKRVISREVLSFLTEEHYEQLGKTASSDYRSLLEGHYWDLLHSEVVEDNHQFGLRTR